MKRPVVLALVLLFATFGVVACYPDLEPAPNTNLLCESDDACPTRQACISGLCGVPETEPRSLGFRLLPAPASGYRPQVVDVAPIDPGAGVDIGMEASIRVAGTVTRGDASGVEGTLVFTRENARTADDVQVTVGSDGAYEALLSPGNYRVKMIPAGEFVPPFVWKDLTFRLNTNWDFTMPGESETRSVTITTNLPTTSVFGDRAAELLAARILAVSRETGVSSTSMTYIPAGGESSPGATLQVFANSGAYDIRISPASPRSIVPEATFENAFTCEENCFATLPGSEGAEIVSLDFEQDFTSLQSRTFALVVGGESTPSWNGVRVFLTRTLERGQLVLRPEVAEDGTFTADLLPGTYTIDVLTPPDTPIASRRFTDTDLESEDGVVALEMNLKQRLAGTVKDVDGAPLVDARVEVDPTDGNVSRFAKAIVATTDGDGRFEAWIEPGDYWASVIPANAALPRHIARINDEVDPGVISWRLAEPTVVYGTVFGAPPQGDDTDEAWKPIEDVAVQVLEKRDGELLVLGEGTTAAEGDFRIAIPRAE